MTDASELPHRDFTPEEKAAIYAKYKKLFTVEDLIGYIDDDEPIFSADDVLTEMRARVESAKAATGSGGNG